MRRSCSRHHERLIDWAESGLDDAARGEFAQHAAGCKDCDGVAQFYTGLREELRVAPSPLPPPVYFEGVLAQIHRSMPAAAPPAAKWRRRTIRREHAATATMGLLLLVWLAPLIHAQWFTPGKSQRRAGAEWAGMPAGAHADRGSAPALIAYEGLGFVAENSPLLKLSAEQWRELGMTPPKPARLLAAARRRGDVSA